MFDIVVIHRLIQGHAGLVRIKNLPSGIFERPVLTAASVDSGLFFKVIR
jgi:hypothetical protein